MSHVTTQQLAAILGVSDRTVLRFVGRDGMPFVKRHEYGNGHGGTATLFDLDAVRAWLASRPWILNPKNQYRRAS